MNNYILNKTNVLLGGQVKWNLTLSTFDNDNLQISDFYLSPISNNVYFSRADRDVLYYTHQQNIKDLYDTIGSNFFNYKVDVSTNKYPIIDDFNTVDTYCSIYDLGAKRIKNGVYEKTMSFFCPLWLENLREDSILDFVLEIYNKVDDDKDTIIEKKFSINLNNQINSKYHNRFENYFKQYIQNIILEDQTIIGDDVININFLDNLSTVTGIDIKTGVVKTKRTSGLLSDLITTLRPLMDTDQLITSTFKDKKMICKQLFNLNFLFDFDDIISPDIREQVRGDEFYFDIHVYVDGEKLEKKSFANDYSKDFKVEGRSVLDYFKDYNYIDIIDKNKQVPNIIHWSLTSNNDYIFNMYPKMFNETNIWATDVESNPEGLLWCNHNFVYDIVSIEEYIKQILLFDDFTKFSDENLIINNVRYKLNKDKNALYLYMIIISDEEWEKLGLEKNSIEVYRKDDNGNYFCLVTNDSNKNKLLFANFFTKSTIDEVVSKMEVFNIDDTQYYTLTDLFESGYDSPAAIRIYNSISEYHTPSPNIISNEIKYNKLTIPGFYIFRYDGKIKPTFVNFEDNKNYEIKKISQFKFNTEWKQYVKTTYKPLYPSINYFYLNEIEKNNVGFEKKWYTDSSLLLLEKNVIFKFTKNIPVDPNTIDMANIIKNNIASYYYIDKGSTDLIDYVYNLYNIMCTFDYEVDQTDKTQFIYYYTIKLTLK